MLLGRIEREIKVKSSIVVDIPENKLDSDVSQVVTVRTSEDLSISGQMSSARTYNVDQVYGPRANQESFFDGVARPICNDFIKGYNCTIFSYGQTGAGKTYTMCGDVNSEKSEAAGFIPRILHYLFDNIESNGNADTIIKCSFVEIYNEELKDLLSCSKNCSRLRIYEHKGKNKLDPSIKIDGLEEFQIRNSNDGFSLLRQGMARRQTAATKMNDLSSRSHSIFTISLFSKKDAKSTEYRYAKMNLVDLAGSENVAKSGSISLRAKEAGSINQSLLTLGRVINCLVDENSFIPYRESKLTRLLQDSLGGRTKTVLVANISPVLPDLSATLSTLDYASRAKNIKNSVQIGPLISDEILVRQLVEENYTLKLDLKATRTKEGVYLDEGNYKNLLLECKNLKSESQETRRKAEDLTLRLGEETKKLENEMKQKDECLKSLSELEVRAVDYENKFNQQKEMHEKLLVTAADLVDLADEGIQKAHAGQSNVLRLVQSQICVKLEDLEQRLNQATSKSLKSGIIDKTQLFDEAEKMSACISQVKGNAENICGMQKDLFKEIETATHEMGGLKSQLEETHVILADLTNDSRRLFNTTRKENQEIYQYVTTDVLKINEKKMADELLMFSTDKIKKFQNIFTKQLSEMFKEMAVQNSLSMKMLLQSKLARGMKQWYETSTDISDQLDDKSEQISNEIGKLKAAHREKLNSVMGHVQGAGELIMETNKSLEKCNSNMPEIVELGSRLKNNSATLYESKEQVESYLTSCASIIQELDDDLKKSLLAKCEQSGLQNAEMLEKLSHITEEVSCRKKRVLGNYTGTDSQEITSPNKRSKLCNSN
ncbi:hypothetical protein FOA43_003982 [Brettanomyces nanus]|uniref:Kinesin-like protein n=1 Tax=Eeniella nana TaxID=13502 RepID=A0A875RQD3_EENNA|nr:uncharacterized protein FOA43_003982 [Brettanomyces nanus]QPG76590.1 hypothetical protein FOA43_003982 [Brettanomyces nanus]